MLPSFTGVKTSLQFLSVPGQDSTVLLMGYYVCITLWTCIIGNGAMYLPLCISCVHEFNLSLALGRLSYDEVHMWRVGAGHVDYQPKKLKG